MRAGPEPHLCGLIPQLRHELRLLGARCPVSRAPPLRQALLAKSVQWAAKCDRARVARRCNVAPLLSLLRNAATEHPLIACVLERGTAPAAARLVPADAAMTTHLPVVLARVPHVSVCFGQRMHQRAPSTPCRIGRLEIANTSGLIPLLLRISHYGDSGKAGFAPGGVGRSHIFSH
ncbi:hypothetical protein MRX96_039562 [Rhipicephalus microplus]